jgi:hypothetical protein
LPLLLREVPEPEERLTLDPLLEEFPLLTRVRVEEASGVLDRLLPVFTLSLLVLSLLEEVRAPTFALRLEP